MKLHHKYDKMVKENMDIWMIETLSFLDIVKIESNIRNTDRIGWSTSKLIDWRTYIAKLKTHKYASRHLLFLSNAACLNLRADISSPSSPATEPFLKNEKST